MMTTDTAAIDAYDNGGVGPQIAHAMNAIAATASTAGLIRAQFGDYAERDETRREHIVEIQTALGLRAMTSSTYREVAA